MNRLKVMQWGDIDSNALLAVEESLTGGGRVVIGNITPVNTGFGDRMHVPVQPSEALDIGGFLELTGEQAADLHEKLGKVLSETTEKGKP